MHMQDEKEKKKRKYKLLNIEESEKRKRKKDIFITKPTSVWNALLVKLSKHVSLYKRKGQYSFYDQFKLSKRVEIPQ